MDAELIIAIVGLFGITVTSVVRWLGFLATINKGARFFGLKRSEPLDLVLVTSDDQQGDSYRRHLTSYDTLRAATRIAERVGELRLDKTTNLRISERLEDPPIQDLVMLGGSEAPKNRVAKVFLEEFNEAHPDFKISRPRMNDDSRKLVVGDDEWIWSGWSDDEDKVNTDVAIIVMWRNPFASKYRRGVYCAGFTAAGTAAATEHLLFRLSREGRKRALGWRRINPFATPCFVSVVEFAFAGQQALPRGEVLFHPLAEPSKRARRRDSGADGAAVQRPSPAQQTPVGREHTVSTHI